MAGQIPAKDRSRAGHVPGAGALYARDIMKTLSLAGPIVTVPHAELDESQQEEVCQRKSTSPMNV
jgi:hypothetical protein